MEIDIINPYVVRIIVAARKRDSINLLAKRIRVSYGWTHKWVQALIRIGVFQRQRSHLILNERNQFYRNAVTSIRKMFSQDISFHYSVLDLFGIRYCFTKTDAVFIWTKGGYNISRFKGHYPIFIKIRKDQLSLFRFYCKKLGLRAHQRKGVFYAVDALKDFEVAYAEGIPVDSFTSTVTFMKRYIFNFQPALEMVQEMYGKKRSVHYREVPHV